MKQFSLTNAEFEVISDGLGLLAVSSPADKDATQFILPGKRFGDFYAALEANGEPLSLHTENQTGEEAEFFQIDGESAVRSAFLLGPLGAEVSYTLKGNELSCRLHLKNNGNSLVVLRDLAVSFPSNTYFEHDGRPASKVLAHNYVSGDSSFVFCTRCDNAPPYLVMVPADGTSVEYFDVMPVEKKHTYDMAVSYIRMYLHSQAAAKTALEKGTRLRWESTCAKLSPGESREYGFRFFLENSYDAVRERLYQSGLLDVEIIPGMTVPRGTAAKLSIRSRAQELSLSAEFPEDTEISLESQEGGRRIYRVVFHKLGENLITVNYGNGKTSYLDFFSTEPVETLIQKRASFLKDCQIRDESKWYDGLLCDFNGETGAIPTPDDTDRLKGYRVYAVTCDDAGLAKPAFLAFKNAEFPVQAEIDALDRYIGKFLWGGMQQTEEELFPYAIYGIQNWKENRDSADPGIGGNMHIWRIYDYPHIVLLYYSMYRVACDYPGFHTELNAGEYLHRAYMTAVAMFLYPQELLGWSAYRLGLYNELVLEDLIASLEKSGQTEKAQRLRISYERKIRYFIEECDDVFVSEHPYDTTGFESTHAFAKYALEHIPPAREESGSLEYNSLARKLNVSAKQRGDGSLTYEKINRFLHDQIQANIAGRGWLETSYYWLGSDYRGSNLSYTLSYMAQMGGWALLDYALYFSTDPYPLLRLGYASMLSSWALINSGDEESNYGFWFPGKDKDGAACGGYEPAPYGETWLYQPHHRGGWYYSCEIDLGFCGALRGMAAILAWDPIFGMTCYGGDASLRNGAVACRVSDGVRRRFHALKGEKRFHLTLSLGILSKEEPVTISEDFSEISATADLSLTNGKLEFICSARGCGSYEVSCNGTVLGIAKGGVKTTFSDSLPKANAKIIFCRIVE